MKAHEIVLEVADTYLDSLSARLSNMDTNDAIARGVRDSRIKSKAKEWLAKWNEKLTQLEDGVDNQTAIQQALQQIVYAEMEATPSSLTDKAIQQLVDLSNTKQTNSNIALKYMTELVTISLLKPIEKQQIEYGGYLPNDMLLPGSIVPVKYILMNDDSNWVKFNGDWYKDVDGSDHQVKLNNVPAINSFSRLENMRSRNVPMRVGQTGTRTLEFLQRKETQEWFNDYE